jgi:NADH-quinone oxidoreductase subunit E/NADP-reducing hydrogenase subunit HndA
MSEETDTDSPVDPAEELPGFFGAEEEQPAERIEPGVWAEIHDFLERNPGGRERLIPVLHAVQRRLGYLPAEVQEYIADKLEMSPVQVYGVVSFYNLFTTTPRALHQFKVCLGTACFVRDARRLLDALEDACGAEAGGISDDGLFNLDQVRCIGACGLAPAIMVDDDVHGNVTPAEAREIARWLRKGAESEAKQADAERADEDPPP